MSERTVAAVLREIDAWFRGERRGQLTWAYLAQYSGFSRQSLSDKEEIVSAYRAVKDRQRLPNRSKPPRSADERIQALEGTIAHLRRIVDNYDERWTRLAWHAGVRNIDLDELMKPLPQLARSAPRKIASRNRRNF